MSLSAVTLSGNKAVGGGAGGLSGIGGGGGLGADGSGNGSSGMGGPVPAGTGEAGMDSAHGGNGGGTTNGTAGDGGSIGSGGDGGGGGSGAGGGGGGGSGMGGAIFNHAGNLALLNCTLTANTATGGDTIIGQGGSGYGGAIFNLNGSVTVAFSTLASNAVAVGTATGSGVDGGADGGAIYALAYNGAASTGSTLASVTLANSILANSNIRGGNDLVIQAPSQVAPGLANFATYDVQALGVNLVMTSNAPIGGLSADPQLGALAANGASNAPHTMALLAGIPAIGAGTCVDASGIPVTADERGVLRPSSHCDLGVYAELIFTDGFELP